MSGVASLQWGWAADGWVGQAAVAHPTQTMVWYLKKQEKERNKQTLETLATIECRRRVIESTG